MDKFGSETELRNKPNLCSAFALKSRGVIYTKARLHYITISAFGLEPPFHFLRGYHRDREGGKVYRFGLPLFLSKFTPIA